MKRTTTERIATLEAQLKHLKERHSVSEAKRKRQEAAQAKKNDMRRRLLVGTAILEQVERGEIPRAQFQQWLEPALSNAEDRALFSW